MKKIIFIIACMMTWSVQAQDNTEQNVSWYEYSKLPLPEVKPDSLDVKLKLIELVSLRKWDIYNQTLNSFEMKLGECNVKIEFSDDFTTVSNNGFYRSHSHHKKPKCSKNWLANIEKDINVTLKILSIQKQAMNIEKESLKNN